MAEAVTDRLKVALASRYAIERQIGQGGMATVYLARDLRHDRKVALKVLRPELAAVIGAERFLHEIRVTASLQHPHILPLHDSGEVDTVLFYVMPYVDGESLRDRLRRERQLPIDDAVRIASEVAGALAYAHGRGVIHRDIKPENILLASGSAVVADFGIARAVTEAGEGRLTETGLSLGTPQYMSPEQATAERELDTRTDIYALAAVVYEMLIGEPPFTGPTTQSVIARVLTESPRSLRVGRPTVPDHIDAAVHKALSKLPADRFRSALEFADALDRPALARLPVEAALPTSVRPSGSRTPLWVAGAVTLAAIAFGISGWLRRPPTTGERVVRSTIHLPDEARAESRQAGSPLALSPDGSVLVYSGRRQLYMRRLDQTDAVPIPNTLGGQQPFFSPDGQHVGFVADGSLKRVPLAGGSVVTICNTPQIQGATWGPGNLIVFGTGSGSGTEGALFQVSADGGTPKRVLSDSTVTEIFRWPDFLPGGGRVLASTGTALDYRTTVVDLKTGRVDTVPGAASNPRYVEPGWLVTVALDGTVTALPFDGRAGRVTGAPIPILDRVATGLGGVAKFGVSRNGWMVYAEGVARQGRLTLVDRHGAQTALGVEAQPYGDPRFSPTGNDVVVTVLRQSGALQGDIWMVNVGRATMSRLTFEGTDQFPDWTPDGRRVLYTTLRPNNAVNWKPAGGGAPDTLLKLTGRAIFDAELTHDAKRLVFRLGGIPGDLYYVNIDSLGTPHVLLDSRFDERAPAVSPDDRWLAYVSDETGRDEVYVRPFPERGGRWVISAAGGGEPRWSHDGKELFYRNADTLFAVSVEARPTFSVGRRSQLFVGSFLKNPRHATYDVHPDGQRFLFISGDNDDSAELMLVQNAVVGAPRVRATPAGR